MEETLIEKQAAEEQFVDPNYKRLFDFNSVKIRLTRLTTANKNKSKVEENRRLRFFAVDSEDLRQKKEIEEDETIVNIRTVNTNIEREQPAFINFLRNSRRIVTFSRKEGLEKVRTEQIEDEFTRGITYPGWELPHYQRLDGAQLHGWDAIEVVFDASKSFHVALDHVGHDCLIFPEGSLDIQSHEVILRKFPVTISQLKDMVRDFEFSQEEVDRVISPKKESQAEDDIISIYKVFIKYNKEVFSGWAELNTANDWLKVPSLHYIGWDEKTGIDPLTGQLIWSRKPLTVFP